MLKKKIANQCSDTTLINCYICSLESASNYKYDSIKNDMSDFRNRLKNYVIRALPIGLYREYAIAIQDEVGDSNGGNV